VEVPELTADGIKYSPALKATALSKHVSYFNIANQTFNLYLYIFQGTNGAAT
jgi:hypothetical protein